MGRTKEENARYLRLISSIHCLRDERAALDEKEQEYLDALVKRLVEQIPKDLHVFL